MKKSILLLIALAFSTVAFSQVKFTKAEQQQMQRILGNDFTAVLGRQGQLAVVTPDKVGQLTSTAKGSFKGMPGLAANAVLAANEKWWVYKQSGDLLKSKLGEERFNQLNKILTKKGLNINAVEKPVAFTRAEQQQLQKVLGRNFTAVLGEQGQLAVVTPDKVGQLKSTARGGFSGMPGLAANAVLAANEKWWVYKQSGDLLKSKLGEERFNQLNTILAKKGLN
ncbi:hypothetical protein EZ428_23665 [Pedobacter frigiditerrae]|uniref:Uncharacterized protein n=1 Tax=Pedobacter frigiditerrae TaxID=2530452 RepID=A0A4R0MJL1_9SPHI|nr:hypothetical protein [Pedobacter frigiditerrae]TCC86467.1 hypothetical protein EZ428_23665 [Pedobacter frigiditerrae]